MGFDEAGVRRRGWVVFAALALIICALALPAFAAAETFEVNSLGDQVDTTAGDEFCLTGGGTCTLRAAIEEANALGGFDVIAFDETVFGVGAGATIVVPSALPAITESLYINGTRECESGQTKPCVGVSGPADAAALRVQGASEVEIERLALTDAEVGIAVEGSTAVKVFGSWFGVRVDGSPGPNQTGALFGPGSDNARIGRPSEGDGNLFANSTAVGLDLFGASGARVLGNRFGVGPDGSTAAANGEDVEVTSDASGGVDAVGNEIGGRVNVGSAGGPCDRECNLISGSAATGLDLQGDGGDEGPAVGTSVVGNYFGLDAAGDASVPNAAAGLVVGGAPQTVVGGTKAADANYFSGGTVAVSAGPAAPDLVLRGNLAGIGGDGAAVPAPDDGLVVDSEGLASAAVEALIEGNELRMDGGVGIVQHGFGARIADNWISSAEVGISTLGAVGPQGNLVAGNAIEQSELNAILVENELNDVVGNRIAGAGAAGIEVRGALPFGIGENVIGGESASEENEVSGSSGAAIAVVNADGTMTTVARNRGAANGGLFIDLVALGSGAKGPNGGIAPPAIFAATSAGAVGTAEPGATVRVYRKRTAAAGEVEGFLGAATVDDEGNWALTYPAPLTADATIAANQTSAEGGSSELALALAKAGGEPGGGGPGGGDGPGPGDKTPPRTAILGGPKARSANTTARFRFASDEFGTKFQCSLDRKPFRRCGSPERYRGLRPGKHVFAVRAVDAAGNVDRSPAKRAFAVVAP